MTVTGSPSFVFFVFRALVSDQAGAVRASDDRSHVGRNADRRVSGGIVDSLNAAVAAVQETATMSRATVLGEFEPRFRVGRMARNYVAPYGKARLALLESA
jgi:hypothetical protein